jgi:uncharacterized protein DUF4054
VNLAAFRARFPEFENADDALVQACLDASAAETSAADWGASYDEAHGLLAADKLAKSPFGTNQRLEAGKETTYQKARKEARDRVILPVFVP